MVGLLGVCATLSPAAAAAAAAGPDPASQAARYHRTPSLRFFQRDGRSLLAIDRALLGKDFYFEVQITSVAPVGPDASTPGGAAMSLPRVGVSLASRALRLRQAGNALLVSEYAGLVGGRFQYHPRVTVPILASPDGKSVVVDAAWFWQTLAPESRRTSAFVEWTADGWASPPPFPRSRMAAMVTRRWDGRGITYAVDVIRLPRRPLRPRLADPRIPYLTNEAGYIKRARLEKRDPAAPVSDVVQPVTVRMTSEIPAEREPYFRKAIEAWNALFESIGFRGALKMVVGDDTLSTDPDSVAEITVMDKAGSGGVTSIRTDPRTDENIGADVQIGPLSTDQAFYFEVMGPQDPHARVPLPDSVVGKLFEIVLIHELGHALGLNHNFKIDAYATDSLRRPDFVRRMGFLPSLMGYSVFNFIAQPEDGMPLDALIAKLGLYDRWALHWGYAPIPEAATPQAELPVLERWRAAQDTAPYLRAQAGEGDPYSQPQLLGDDALKSVDYGIRNIARLSATAHPALTDQERAMLIRRWEIMFDFLPPLIGGKRPQAPYPQNLAEVRMQPIDSAYQVRALRFILDHQFYGRDSLVRQMVPASRRGDSTLVFFDTLLPEWASAESGLDDETKTMAYSQQEALVQLAERFQALDGQREQAGTLAGLCQEMAAFRRQFSAQSAAAPPATKEYVETMSGALADIFASGTGPCAQAP